MISFRDREDVGPALVSILSIVVLVAAAILYFVVKPPSLAAINGAASSQIVSLKKETKKANLATAASQAPIDNLTWTGDPEVIGTTALQTATALAIKHGLKLTVFRPQHAALVDNLVTLPYVVTVEGSYLGALQFARDFSDPKTKLAVTQIQISSADPNSDKVTANVGITAYVNPKEELPIDSSSSTLQTRRDIGESNA